jgi:hypothetical protein
MRIGDYSVRINEALEDAQGYAAIRMLNGKASFTLTLTNHGLQKSEINLQIHGIDQGTWIIHPLQTATIERPAHIAEKFHAYAVQSSGGDAIGLKAGDPNNGVVQATFKPELIRPIRPLNYDDEFGILCSKIIPEYGEAGVGTEGHSSQQFESVTGFQTDDSKTVVISLRIVEDKTVDTPRPLSSASANPLPPPIV